MEEEDGVVVVVVVGMEEEMEEKKVEELVEVMVVEMEGGVVEIGRPKEGAWLRFAAIALCWLLLEKKEEKKWKREEWGSYI